MLINGPTFQTWLHRIPAGGMRVGLGLSSRILLQVDDWWILAGALAMIAKRKTSRG